MNLPVTFTNRDPLTLLQAEAKRRPEIAKMIRDVHGMSDADIAALKVPLPWYRKALKKVRDLRIQEGDKMAITAAILKLTHIVYLNDREQGAVRRWDGNNEFIKLGKSGSEVELKTGQYVWFPETGGVWIESIFSAQIDPKLINCTFIERSNRDGYMKRVCERRNQMEAPSEVYNSDSGGSSWFRIERH
jgi:hypothetical protein